MTSTPPGVRILRAPLTVMPGCSLSDHLITRADFF
jgi:hypothetical protein